MKVLHINSFDGGSTGRIAREIAKTAAACRWDSQFLYGRNWGRTPVEGSAKFTTRKNTLLHVVRARLFDCMGLGSKSDTHRLIRYLNNERPDLIHLHNIHGYYLNYKIFFEYLQRADIPVVWTLHDCWPFTGHCTYFDLIGCDKWKTGCYSCPQTSAYPKSIFRDNSRRNFELKRALFTALGDRLTLVPVSNWLGDIVRNSFFSGCNIQPIYNGVDTEIFRPLNADDLRAKFHLENKRIVLGVAAPWTHRKGFDDYLRLRSRLSEDYVIIMVGLTHRQISRLSPGMIGLTRTQNRYELARFYSMADVVLSLSREETFGLTIAEGLACGTPAVVYDCTAVPELVSVETGLVVEPGDIGQLVSAIGEITANGKAHYAVACRKRAEGLFDKKDRFREYIDLYNRLLNK